MKERANARGLSFIAGPALLAILLWSCSTLNQLGVAPQFGKYGPKPTPTASATPTATPLAMIAPQGALLAGERAAPAAPQSSLPGGQPLDRIVASVDGDPITLREVHAFAAQNGHPFDGDDLANSDDGKGALKAMIGQMLLEHEAKKFDDKIDEAQVDRYIDDVRNEKHMTEPQFRAALQQSGISYDDFRKHSRLELERVMMMRSEVSSKVEVSDQEIQDFYDAHKSEFMIKSERYRLAQVLIAVPQTASPAQVAEARKKADMVRAFAVKGLDFNGLAHKYSDDDSKSAGGELGWFSPGDIMDEILHGIKGLKPGDISPVIRSKHGFHILKVEDHEVPGPVPLAQMKDQIREHLVEEKSRDKLGEWVDTELVKTHYVEIKY
ncbi:MAG TPA: peptidylprolyl isomerase [Candidatus Binataceae bacterium]|nr:peptidylprolyl isomerase [Candidatus Binataceae bacterium]